MPAFEFSPAVRWIWTPDSTPPQNAFVCFRHEFDVVEARDALLHLTADARYEVFLNGEWLGHGPIRSWPSPWPVDEYDLAGHLKPGRNVLAVLVQDFGISTFQYLKDNPGVRAQISWNENGNRRELSTDESWRTLVHPSFAWSVPRINVQTGWEEQFDARLEPRDMQNRDWREIGFVDEAWPRAIEAKPNSHEEFETRPIPHLTRERREPVRLVRTEAVTTAPISLSFNLRDALNPQDETANYLLGRMLVATHIHSDEEQEIELHFAIGPQGFNWKLNGEPLPCEGEELQLTEWPVLRLRLRAGWNTLLARPLQLAHSWRASVNIWPQRPLKINARPVDENVGVWLGIGPFGDVTAPEELPGLWQSQYVRAAPNLPGATGEKWEEIWNRGELSRDEMNADWVKPLGARGDFALDVFAVCASERVSGEKPFVDESHALLHDSADWTTIHPLECADTRLLFDWGDEWVGFHEWEIEAPEGTIVDFQGFEFIQRDGRLNLCDLMNNSFRYVCREGFQTYRTFGRRGFRFGFFSFRNHQTPVKIRRIRAVVSTYPVAQNGDFRCSDALLERIWHVGAQSVRVCAEDAYTDCPGYEQVFWVGDARNEALVDLVANGDPKLSAHCWRLAARSLDRMPLVEATAPSGRPLILPAWTFLWMRWAHEHFVLTGDLQFAADAIPWLERNIDGIEAHLNSRDLFEIVAWNMFDWAPMDTPPDGIVTHQNCLAVLGLRQNAEFARVTGFDPFANRCDELADRLSRAINSHLWNTERNAYTDCLRADGTMSPVVSQQTQTAAYLAGVCAPPFGSPEREERCRSIVDEAPDGFVSAGSPFFMFFLLEALRKQNRIDGLVQTIRDYWGPQIEAGATTFWEMYHPHKARLTRSHCHGWSAAPTFFLTQHVLGVSPLEAGYRTVLVAPNLSGVSWAQGRVPTPHGAIEVFWEFVDERFRLRLKLPEGVKARVELPVPGELIVETGVARLVVGEKLVWETDLNVKYPAENRAPIRTKSPVREFAASNSTK
jgi:hypothetical protein